MDIEETNIPDYILSLRNSANVDATTSTDPLENTFRLTDLLSNRDKLNSFTGLPNEALLTHLENELRKIGIVDSTLSVRDKIVLTLARIKTNLTFQCLSVLFSVSPPTASQCFKKIAPCLSVILGDAIYWPSKDEVLKNLPKCFQKYSNVSAVLDCTEIHCPKPQCLQCRVLSYSHYKGGQTAKFLVSVTPAGLINFVSKAYGGRASDKVISEQCGILENFEPHSDAVMVDKGFNIESECNQRLITVVQPPFLRKKTQFSEDEAKKTQSIATARVHVERVIQRIKMFKLLSEKVDCDLLPYIDYIFRIVCGLVNLSKPVLAEDKFIR